MVDSLKEALRSHLPAWAFRPARRIWHALARTEYVRLGRQFAISAGDSVQAGPFRGMRYPPDMAGGVTLPKLLGAYEQELHTQVEELIATEPHLVVNIGSGEGYYAVGLALRLPQARVVAVDTAPGALSECLRLARRNGVHNRVRTVRAVDADGLETLLEPDALVVMDCEGCEADLLDPALAPTLRQCTVLVELHEFRRSGLTELVLSRFRASHRIDVIDSESRDPRAYPALSMIPERNRATALSEYRPEAMQWAVLRPRSDVEAQRPGPG